MYSSESKDGKKKSSKAKKGKASRRRGILKKAKSEALLEASPALESTRKGKRACKKKRVHPAASEALPPAASVSKGKRKAACKKKRANPPGSKALPEAPATKGKRAKKGSNPGPSADATNEAEALAPVAKPKAKSRSHAARPRSPADPAVVQQLLMLLWDYAGCEYDLTGFTLHEQAFPGLRLNVYWSRNHVGIHDKSIKRDIVNFTSPTETIITHLHMAHTVATCLNYCLIVSGYCSIQALHSLQMPLYFFCNSGFQDRRQPRLHGLAGRTCLCGDAEGFDE